MSLQFPAIDPVAISIGPFAVRWYALAYLAGFLGGWRYILHLAALDKPQKLPKEAIDDFLSWMIIGVILGGRCGYVLFYNFSMYLSDPLEMFKVWHGGMSFHGGALGAIAAMIVYSYWKKLPLLHLTDLVCCAVPIGLFFGRLANFVNGELFGRVTAMPWGMIFPNGGDLPRHPSQIYEAGLEGLALGTVLAICAHKSGIRNRPGLLSGIFLFGYACARIFVEHFREPDVQVGFLFGGLTMGQILCAPMILGALYLFYYATRRKAT
jgi:phosphatidylglycerol:prolipoprotein diacylglycerol transferase